MMLNQSFNVEKRLSTNKVNMTRYMTNPHQNKLGTINESFSR